MKGILVANLTPFDERGRVDLEELGRHVDFLAQAGIPAIAPAGTTGEFLYLSSEEKRAVVATAVEAAKGRMAVIAGTWGFQEEELKSLCTSAETAGAGALFFTTPIYYPASDASVMDWYRAARTVVSLPIFAYHIPQYAANSVSPQVFRQLLDEGVVQGIKDSTGQPDRLRTLVETARGEAPVYGASDSFALKARELGASGFISALANIYPRTFLRIWEGDAAAQAAIDQVRTAVKGYGGIGALKVLLGTRGFRFGGSRLPCSDLSATEVDALHRLGDSLGEALS